MCQQKQKTLGKIIYIIKVDNNIDCRLFRIILKPDFNVMIDEH